MCSFIQIWTFLCIVIVNTWGLSSCMRGAYFAFKTFFPAYLCPLQLVLTVVVGEGFDSDSGDSLTSSLPLVQVWTSL